MPIQDFSLGRVCPVLLLVAVSLTGLSTTGRGQSIEVQPPPFFLRDAPDVVQEGKRLADRLSHDASLLSLGENLLAAWLEFVPGEGEILRVGERNEKGWADRGVISDQAGYSAHPVLTRGSDGRIWLSYEAEVEGNWDLFLVEYAADTEQYTPARVTTSPGPDVRHEVVADSEGGLRFVWQSETDGQFDILTRRFSDGELGMIENLTNTPTNDWAPDIALLPGNDVCVAWDTRDNVPDGTGYDVVGRFFSEGTWHSPFLIAGSPAMERGARLASSPNGDLWVAWDEGAEEWGEEYRSGDYDTVAFINIDDRRGPLHRFRRFRVAEISSEGAVDKIAPAFPYPSLDAARIRSDDDGPTYPVGMFYERPELEIDNRGRLWVGFRHYYAQGLGIDTSHHIDEGWGVYARYLTDTGWSESHGLAPDQGDGLQRLALTPHGEGVAAVWVCGRTDRRPLDRPQGLFVAELEGAGTPPPRIDPSAASSRRRDFFPAKTPLPSPPVVRSGDREYSLYYGDLHRHTDLSLCRVPADGTLDDAYRYGIDVAQLDFLGITDHARDLGLGDPAGLIWWRCRKEVTRHALGHKFMPLFTYERSRHDTDHNVVSLCPDMLRSHTVARSEFWKELDENTFTIPHQPFSAPGVLDLWKIQDNGKRPLLEIYQGCRDRSMEDPAHRGLDKGYRFGFIASSDHLSTSASYACVWAPEPTREAIFQAMKERRTFGATGRINLRVQSGEAWMGEGVPFETPFAMSIEAHGTSSIETAEVLVDGKVSRTLEVGERDLEEQLDIDLPEGARYLYVRITQDDDKQAWSSPFFFESAEK